MDERGLRSGEVSEVVRTGEIIAEYPGDSPHPSYLVLGFAGTKPLHVLVARAAGSTYCLVVTVYAPNSKLWSADFKVRRRS
jgi:hypothetical protein